MLKVEDPKPLGRIFAMLAKSRWLLSLGFFSLLFTGSAWAQITAVEGQVTGADGKPVPNAQILIVREDMKGTYKGAKTDKKGHYIYNGL
ncbi:MAG TPA: carboxypeptidase-like regulatory domain-containing protein, partial [Chthonomonadales bacterium]|nr:carboxypeptidase-like regulatory domain-containing protein [Chthonomonadales bacterium]